MAELLNISHIYKKRKIIDLYIYKTINIFHALSTRILVRRKICEFNKNVEGRFIPHLLIK